VDARGTLFDNGNFRNDLRDFMDPGSVTVDRQFRPTVAKSWLRPSISRRISLFVALIVTCVVTTVAYLQVRSFEGAVDRDLVNAGRLGAQSVADDLALRDEPLDPLDVRDMLHDLVNTEPLIGAISVIEIDDTGHSRIFASTSTEEQTDVVNLADRTIRTGTALSSRSGTGLTIVMPVPKHSGHAVAVDVGLESLLQARQHSLALAVGFAVPAILLVTILVHVTIRQLLGGPLDGILHTMARTAQGDVRARADASRGDELGAIATGLNTMLSQLEHFNQSLHDRIDEATRDLSLRNAELTASQNQLLATREALARAERVAALGQVAANVAHQAGTPLNLVSGYVQMILDDPKTDERTRSRLRTVEAQIQNVTRVLRTMLDRAYPTSGFEAVSLGDVISRVREIARPRLWQSNIRLDTSVVSDLPAVQADPTQLEMALLNLITNALDAMPRGGRLSITARAEADGVRLEVADTGPGLPPDILEHLFDPWVTTKPAGHGSGLGLAIVRDVVRTHGGSISAHNQSPGAVFVIDLPAGGAAAAS
jgi:signal transduction histidine kinase